MAYSNNYYYLLLKKYQYSFSLDCIKRRGGPEIAKLRGNQVGRIEGIIATETSVGDRGVMYLK